jgi:hypothetical protein
VGGEEDEEAEDEEAEDEEAEDEGEEAEGAGDEERGEEGRRPGNATGRRPIPERPGNDDGPGAESPEPKSSPAPERGSLMISQPHEPRCDGWARRPPTRSARR